VPAFLVVDDSPTIRLALAAGLRNIHHAGCEIVEAGTEAEALDRFSNARFDVVFLDMMLSRERSALELLRAMLAQRPDARIILMTGLARESHEVVEAISLGAFGYLRKPVRTADVSDVLKDIEAEAGHLTRIR
jgi:CheY-like chemotaxis protein